MQINSRDMDRLVSLRGVCFLGVIVPDSASCKSLSEFNSFQSVNLPWALSVEGCSCAGLKAPQFACILLEYSFSLRVVDVIRVFKRSRAVHLCGLAGRSWLLLIPTCWCLVPHAGGGPYDQENVIYWPC